MPHLALNPTMKGRSVMSDNSLTYEMAIEAIGKIETSAAKLGREYKLVVKHHNLTAGSDSKDFAAVAESIIMARVAAIAKSQSKDVTAAERGAAESTTPRILRAKDAPADEFHAAYRRAYRSVTKSLKTHAAQESTKPTATEHVLTKHGLTVLGELNDAALIALVRDELKARAK